MVEEVASRHVLQKEVDSQLILEDIVHRKDEGVLGLKQNVLLSSRVNNLSFFDKNIFIYSLHGIFFPVFLIYYKKNLTKRAFI
jgi:hypothetical protein